MSIVAAFVVPHPPLIVPNVGGGRESEIDETARAYDAVAREIADIKPDTIVVTSPHSVMYADYFHISPGSEATGSFKDFGAPEVNFREKYDEEFVERLEETASTRHFPAGTMGEKNPALDHGTMVPLFFVEKYYRDFSLVRIGLSGLDLTEHYRLGQMISECAKILGRKTILIASGDLSHKLKEYGPYGFAKEGPEYDERIMKDLSSGDFEALLDYSEDFCDKAAECGHRSFVIMSGALDGTMVNITPYSHQDVTGVGYGIVSFKVTGEDKQRQFLSKHLEKKQDLLKSMREKEDLYVRLARTSLEKYIKYKEIIDVSKTLAEPELKAAEDEVKTLMNTKAGAFVSIHKNGRLRGCIGTFLPTEDNLAEEIAQNAVSASTRDPRFDAITEDELPWLEISVDVLGTPEDISSTASLDPKRYGVIVRNGSRRGLLLPDLEGVDTVEEQISIAKRKAGIADNEQVSLQRFEVVRHR